MLGTEVGYFALLLFALDCSEGLTHALYGSNASECLGGKYFDSLIGFIFHFSIVKSLLSVVRSLLSWLASLLSALRSLLS